MKFRDKLKIEGGFQALSQWLNNPEKDDVIKRKNSTHQDKRLRWRKRRKTR